VGPLPEAQLLTRYGAAVNSSAENGYSAVWLALQYALTTMFRAAASLVEGLVKRGVRPGAVDSDAGLHSWHVFAREGPIDAVRALDAPGVDLRFADGLGRWSLGWGAIGCRYDHSFLEAVDEELGAYSEARNKAGECALHLSSGLHNHEYTSALLERGANVNPRDSIGRTRLVLACAARERGCIKYGHNNTLRHTQRHRTTAGTRLTN
jgi:ankyrin repeat protein